MTEPTGDAPYAELLDVAREAARRAGDLLRDGRPADLGVAATKTSPIDVVTEMDLAAEKLITDFLAERRPDDGLLGEEGTSTTGSSGVRWIIDPIDGTVNYLYGRADWAVSVAAEREGETLVGVVHAPQRGETHHAVLGQGARCDGRPVRCRPGTTLDQALIATGFNYVQTTRDAQAAVVRALLPRVRDIRRSGSAALDLCDVASGRLDGYYERGTNHWDYAAGDLIAREAGALTGGLPGRAPGSELLVAATPEVFPVLQPLLAELGAGRG
ncbi:inositol monophosphatase family protein [Streptomyces sp. JJ38]|uniref:inositol monophosphatase family protein n=1 Tax=Streptomyces sp. JJ38 TaxID=2738128 RepID=UPI001C57C270|nr:inositol monophosphatase family protein [Streptomyces sp. JJ38]MBW1595549.1 inositol monophosphatase [Streptomyces sp. JJ38]